MLGLAGYPLGCSFRMFAPEETSCSDELCERIRGDFMDFSALEKFATGLDVITFEFENIPVEAVKFLSRTHMLAPSFRALEVAQDRFIEKTYLRSLGIPTPDFCEVNSTSDAKAALKKVGLPYVLKTRRMGYDGKGQVVVRTEGDADSAFASLGSVPLIAEAFVKFDRELSVIGVRSRDGSFGVYPLFQNSHRDGILVETAFPSPDTDSKTQSQAGGFILDIMKDLDYFGVCTLELFDCGGSLVANEIAPRVHNSGHVTIEAAETSQFENHIRAVTGFPVGSCNERSPSTMLNIIGKNIDIPALLALPGCHPHWYGKSPRPGRKVGHVTVTNSDSLDAARKLCA